MSQEYGAAIAIIVGAVLKGFGVEIENKIVEGIVFGLLALWIAIRRHQKGDITAFGIRK